MLSVYVDDIIISADNESVIKEALAEMRNGACLSHFPINSSKSRGPDNSLEAFNIQMRPGSIEISADRYEEMCRDVMQNGAGPANDGILSYVRSVNDAQAEHMQASFPNSF